MKVRDAMTEHVLTITPGRSLREAARFMEALYEDRGEPSAPLPKQPVPTDVPEAKTPVPQVLPKP